MMTDSLPFQIELMHGPNKSFKCIKRIEFEPKYLACNIGRLNSEDFSKFFCAKTALNSNMERQINVQKKRYFFEIMNTLI